MFFLGALYLQRVLGYDALEVGLAFLPVAVAIGVLSLGFSARLMTRFGERADAAAGARADRRRARCCSPRAPVDGDYVTDLLPSMLLLGVGAGLSFPALMTLAMSGATPSDSGLASGLVNTTQQVGGALGLAVLATLVDDAHGRPARRAASRAASRADGRLPPRVRARRRRWWSSRSEPRWRCYGPRWRSPPRSRSTSAPRRPSRRGRRRRSGPAASPPRLRESPQRRPRVRLVEEPDAVVGLAVHRRRK